MNTDKRLIFHIDAYSPESIPMSKLADYMADFATLLGRDHIVHFAGLEHGSTKIAARVAFEDMPKVTARLDGIKRGNLTKETSKLFEQIDTRLANDNAIGQIYIDTDVAPNARFPLLAFPGRDRPKTQSYGPFSQDGHLDGQLIAVGGRDDTVPLRLENGETVYSGLDTSRALAVELGKHLYQQLRVHGIGRWSRDANGKWVMHRFRVHRFEVLASDALRDVVTTLRAVPGNRWKDLDDPLGELADLRRDDDNLH